MPMLTTLRIGFPVWPLHSPERTRSANAAIRSSTSCTWATTSTPSTISDASRGMRSATCSTERFSETLIRSPLNIASRRSLEVRLLRQFDEQAQRLVGDAVLRIVEVQAACLRAQALAALGILGEQLAQVPSPDGLVVVLKCAEGLPPAEGSRGHGSSAFSALA